MKLLSTIVILSSLLLLGTVTSALETCSCSCSHCAEATHETAAQARRCRVCDGRGSILCNACDGSGKDLLTGKTCYFCSGRGRLKCLVCYGTGVAH
ncbi:MAG: hypothetical protein KDA84_09265 [Planctomycetaceae bacterium]|nr:hypothetical protein [Planctomycetaceae bacterium]